MAALNRPVNDDQAYVPPIEVYLNSFSFEDALLTADLPAASTVLDNVKVGGRAVVDIALVAAETLPVFGPAAQLLTQAIALCDEYKCQKDAFIALKNRLKYLYNLYFNPGG